MAQNTVQKLWDEWPNPGTQSKSDGRVVNIATALYLPVLCPSYRFLDFSSRALFAGISGAPASLQLLSREHTHAVRFTCASHSGDTELNWMGPTSDLVAGGCATDCQRKETTRYVASCIDALEPTP